MENTFYNYSTTFLRLCLIYNPVLIWVASRKWLKKKFPSFPRALIWISVFLVYPLIQFLDRAHFVSLLIVPSQLNVPLEDTNEFGKAFFAILGGSLLATEIVLYFNENLSKLKEKRWINQLSFERLLLLILIFLSLFSSLLGIIEIANKQNPGALGLIWRFFSFSIQFFLISLVYYFYYAVNKNILIPKLLKVKGALHYGFAIAGMILILYPIFIALIQHMPVVRELEVALFYPTINLFGQDGGGLPFIIMLLTVPFIVSNQWYQQSTQIISLEKEKSETELNLLKQQINPHFFFNTLNNLYALSITKDKQTPEVILKLSELMRYVIYKGKEAWVPLEEEIQYIEDYIQLQQIRLHKGLDYKFEKSIEQDTLQIPPLLFITFVENAFKHGIEPAEGDCSLHLKLEEKNGFMVFSCENSIEPDEKGTKVSGIGLQNLKRRLALRFPQEHELFLNKEVHSFKASLKINSYALKNANIG